MSVLVHDAGAEALATVLTQDENLPPRSNVQVSRAKESSSRARSACTPASTPSPLTTSKEKSGGNS
jgi:hypothetical protein